MKKIDRGQSARERLVKGALHLSKLASVSYGPEGRTVFLNRVSGDLLTRDGATIVREISLEDPVENLGCQVMKEASIKVADAVGDGSTTTLMLAGALLEECHKLVTAGCDPVALGRGIQKAFQDAVTIWETMSSPVDTQEQLADIARVSTHGDEDLSLKLAEAVFTAGEYGTVVVEDGNGLDTTLDFKDGLELQCNPHHRRMLRDQLEREMSQPLVAIFKQGISSLEELDVVEVASQWPHPLLMFTPSLQGEALDTWILNSERDWVVLSVPGFGTQKEGYLNDLAALTGATIVDKEAGMSAKSFEAEWFGKAMSAAVRDKATTIVAYPEFEDSIQERIQHLEVEAELSEHNHDKDLIRQRMAALSGGLCVLSAGGYTEAEMKERRARIEDALGALQTALKGGVVPGCGTALLFASDFLDVADVEGTQDNVYGYRAFSRALQEPLRKLASNSDYDASVIVSRLRNSREEFDYDPRVGWDPLTDTLRRLDTSPCVMTPTDVVIEAARHAVSVVTTLITTEAAVYASK